MDRIKAHLELVRRNWEAALKGGRNILWTILYKDTRTGKAGSLSTWRSTNNGWFSQHLTSQGFPTGVCAMLLTSQATGIKKNFDSKNF